MFNLSLNVRHAVRLAITGAAAAASTAAFAQQTAAVTNPPAKELEEVIVTGTRIQQSPNSVSMAPVASISAEDIQKTGLVRTEDLLNTCRRLLPNRVLASRSVPTVPPQSVCAASVPNARWCDQRSPHAARRRHGQRFGRGHQPDPGLDGRAGRRADGRCIRNLRRRRGRWRRELHHEDALRRRADRFEDGQNQYGQEVPFAQAALAAKGDPVPGSLTGGQKRNWSFMAGSNFADGKGNATVYGTYLNTSPVVAASSTTPVAR